MFSNPATTHADPNFGFMPDHPEDVEPGSVALPGPSYARTVARFDAAGVADDYPAQFGRTFRGRREARCLKRCLRHITAGGHVLDLPCGTGRLIPYLIGEGFRVTAADASPRMIERARRLGDGEAGGRVEFAVREVLDSGFETNRFDGVICHRLFHHFNEPATRVAALRELGRISRGPVIVSFFNSFAASALRFRLKHVLRGTTPTDRIPIPLRTFRREAEAAGLRVAAHRPVLWGLSPLWFLVLNRR